MLWYPPTFTMLKFGEKSMITLKTLYMCSAPKNSYLSGRTYSDTSAELVEARVGLTSFGHVQICYYNS